MRVTLRSAVASDAEAIGLLHADSWRRNYRGAYADEYLDNEVFADRRAVWQERLTSPDPSTSTVVAELDGALVGFTHTVFDQDPTWGALLDNLHVSHELKRQSVGTRLMAESARRLLARSTSTPLFLWVLEQNTAGQAFYRARGGSFVERIARDLGPGYALRCAWSDPSVLL